MPKKMEEVEKGYLQLFPFNLLYISISIMVDKLPEEQYHHLRTKSVHQLTVTDFSGLEDCKLTLMYRT